ncbi:hypothetical protein IAU59_006371 [Kwoniella sp. CBS 9459]
MDGPPLTLNVTRISPPSLISSYIPNNGPLPALPRPLPSPPTGFSFSPTPNYPAPFGFLSLGSTLSLDLALENTHLNRQDVLGVKMMVEVQGPSGRYRLGEVIHSNKVDTNDTAEAKDEITKVDQPQADDDAPQLEGEELPSLKFGDNVTIQMESEMKDLGMNVVIVSVAWETLEGRRTMQRFLKFNVNPPLAIKTRIQTSSHPNTALSREKREDVYLEVLMQNVSNEGMKLSDVFLEAVQGLKSRAITREHKSSNTQSGRDSGEGSSGSDSEQETLLPNDTRQYLFVLSPDPGATVTDKDSPLSIFPPTFPAGTILPLGRLDVSWVSGVYHVPGRLQTSTLNRRVPASATLSAGPGVASRPLGPGMSRTLSAQSASGASATPLTTPSKERGSLLAPSPLHGNLNEETEAPQWEFDLTMKGEREFEMEKTFKLAFKLGMRSARPIIDDSPHKGYSLRDGGNENENEDDNDEDDKPLSRRASRLREHELPPPPPPKIAIQYLTPIPPSTSNSVSAGQASGPQVQVSVLPPSRTSTPLSPPPRTQIPGDKRAFTPSQPSALGSTSSLQQGLATQTSSRPGTPLSTQLRQAQSQGLTASANVSVAGSVPGTPHFGSGVGQSSRTGASASTVVPVVLETTIVPVVDFPPVPSIIQTQQILAPPKASNTTLIPHVQGNHLQSHNQVIQTGNSLIVLPSQPLLKVLENTGPSYSTEETAKKQRRWEAAYKFELEFIAFDEGLAGLGGLRVLVLDDEEDGEEGSQTWSGAAGSGYVAREWESLGDLSIWG